VFHNNIVHVKSVLNIQHKQTQQNQQKHATSVLNIQYKKHQLNTKITC